MSGHLFITRGDLTGLACDAILIPSGTDSRGRRGDTGWDAVAHLLGPDGLVTGAPQPPHRVALIDPGTPESPALWLGHTGDDRPQEADWYAAALAEFVRKAGTKAVLTTRPLNDSRPLLAVPLVGTGDGGMRNQKGEVVVAAVRALSRAVQEVDADVVLVLDKRPGYTAAQQARERFNPHWIDVDAAHQQVARDLAVRARADRLVLFMGAGTGAGAGLPSWASLLTALGQQAELSEDELTQLKKLDHRDAGAIINRRLVAKGTRLTDAISHQVDAPRVSLLHQLLASLPVTEAVTTNYDTLFERAWRATDRDHAVLPSEPAHTAKAWLLKLHGSVDDPGRIVLSRDDYLRFEAEGVALAGVVQAMLLTRHMLFVGYSLTDDNFHRLVHQVRGTVGSASERPGGQFGTALTPSPARLVSEIWADDLTFVGTASDPDDGGAERRIAIFLDLLASEASAPAAHVLDGAYDAVFSEDEKLLRSHLRDVERAAEATHVRPALRRAVTEAIAHLSGP